MTDEELAIELRERFPNFTADTPHYKVHAAIYGDDGLLSRFPNPIAGDNVRLRNGGRNGTVLHVDRPTRTATVQFDGAELPAVARLRDLIVNLPPTTLFEDDIDDNVDGNLGNLHGGTDQDDETVNGEEYELTAETTRARTSR